MRNYLEHAVTPASRRHQKRRGVAERYRQIAERPAPTGLGPDEVAFLTARDSFYLASSGEDGWPYVQHRGGPPGFLHVLDSTTIAWAERAGNRQYLSAGNIDANGRVALIAVDYPNRRRLKLTGTATYHTDPDAGLAARLHADGDREAIVTVDVVAFDWNCPKFITPRYTRDELDRLTRPLLERVRELETRLAAPGPGIAAAGGRR